MELSLSGATQDAVKFALSMLDVGTREEEIIVDVLAVSQRRVGERWHKNDLSVADEHLATGVAEATLCALASDTPPPTGHGSVVVACAEGDWHSIAAHMISEQLRAEGIRVIFLGASTPADSVARMLGQYRPNALAVSCNLALFFGGITRLADAAHVHGVPVLAGGRALQSAPVRAQVLGADAYAGTVSDAMRILTAWTEKPPAVKDEPHPFCLGAAQLEAESAQIADLGFSALSARFPRMTTYTPAQLERTREDLAYIVRFIAAARQVDDLAVFIEFLDWLAELLLARGVPIAALVGGLEVLEPLLRHDPVAASFAVAGVGHLG